MVVNTLRMQLVAYDFERLHTAAGDPVKAAEAAGFKLGHVTFQELDFKKRIYRDRLKLMRQDPKAWLLCTVWQMVLKDRGTIVGELGFKGLMPGGEVEIGYSTNAIYRNMGYMTEAVSALCCFAFGVNEYKIKAVTAITQNDNYASQRVLEKSGFKAKGRVKNTTKWHKNA